MKKWKIKFTKRALKELGRLPHQHQEQISHALDRLALLIDPQEKGEPLHGNYKGLWRYRIGVYRVITKVEKKVLSISVIRVAHRQSIYRHMAVV